MAAAPTPQPADSTFVPTKGVPSGVADGTMIPDTGSFLSCGDAVESLRSSPDLAVSGEFPDRLPAGGEQMFTGTITVSSSGPTVSGVTSPSAAVYLTRSGRAVTTALPQDAIAQPVTISPSAALRLPAAGATFGCRSDGSTTALEPGRYEAFAVVAVTDDEGTTVVAAGGPWVIDLE